MSGAELSPAKNGVGERFHPDTRRDIDGVVAAIQGLVGLASRPRIVALDGRSGSGKSTLAKEIAALVGGITIEADDFWAGGANEVWDERSPAEKVALAIDWKRLRAEALGPLMRGEAASWHPFDFESGHGLSDQAITRGPTPLIVLDGAYSARPELSDIIDLKVLVEVPEDGLRRTRLVTREGNSYMNDWHSRWDAAEDYYFTEVRPRASFDLVIVNR